ncbi:K homology domain-containing protein [Tanacetum coccineum]
MEALCGSVQEFFSLSKGEDSEVGAHYAQLTKMLPKRVQEIMIQVGVLIGKAGDTIRKLKNSSGARIQITRDAVANPHSANSQGADFILFYVYLEG